MDEKKIITHPHTILNKRMKEQEKQIAALKIDVEVLRDLLHRTIKMLAKYEDQGILKLPKPKQ